jgi:hypothetical protein
VLILLIAAFALLWLLIVEHREAIGFGNLSIRGSFVLAYLAFELVLLAITELTSIGHHMTVWSVAGCWLLVVAGAAVGARPTVTRLVRRARSGPDGQPRLRALLARLDTESWIWVGVMVLIMGVLVVEGSIYPPGNTDSMVYHLARVAHWVQNRSIAPFATHYTAQVELSPLSEYNLAHLHLLTGTDRFDWSMQWLAALVSIVGASELARLLGASRSTQIAASVICATVPSGILLSVTTENDYFAAALGMGLLIVLAAFSFSGRWIPRTIALGAAAGLAYLAKGTMPSMIGPAALALFGVAVYRRVRAGDGSITWPKVARWVGVTGATVIAVVGPFVAQTVSLFGSAIGPVSRGTINAQFTLSGFGANVTRATAGNFEIGDGVSGISSYTSMVVLGILRHLYPLFGVSEQDRRYVVGSYANPFVVKDYTFFVRLSDYGANPWHVLLAVAALVMLGIGVLRGRRALRVPLLLGIALSVGYVLFSGTARWSPFEVRYAMPLFVVWSAVIAVALGWAPRWVTRIVLIGLVVGCLPQLLSAAQSPVINPVNYHGSYLAGYFPGNQTAAGNAEASDYQTVAAMLSESTCRRAALDNWVFIEYPLWVGLQHDRWRGLLNDFDVDNKTTSLQPSYRPCASITQQGPGYVTPDDGTVNAQLGNLALSLYPADAATVRTPVPRFESHVAGTRVLPGGGWAMASFGNLPFLTSAGSLYVISPAARRDQIELTVVPGHGQPTVTVSGPRGLPTIAHLTSNTYTAEITVGKGVNRIDLSAVNIPKIPKQHRRLVLLQSVVLAPAGG